MPGNVPAVEGERANLLAYLEQQRAGIRLTAFGLTEEQARALEAQTEGPLQVSPNGKADRCQARPCLAAKSKKNVSISGRM
jgi:hypothetical protein